MAKAKIPTMRFKTPVLPLYYLNVRGKGKLKMDAPDDGNPDNYQYTATVKMDKKTADGLTKTIDKYWRDNKPSGVGKRKFELIKPEMEKVLDDAGKPVLDEDDEPVRKPTGLYTMQSKTITCWPDGKSKKVILMGSNGKELPEGHPLEEGCGEGTEGIIHGTLGVTLYSGNEGVTFYLNGVQIKESTYTPYSGNNVEAEEIEDDVADTDVPDESDGEMPSV